MKRILMIGTGGTIASEMTDAGLVPELTSKQLLRYVPQIDELCHVDCLQICNIDSTNMQPSHWLLMQQTIERNYDCYDGFVLSHGTDTMAYTAAALSYLVQNSQKPIVITGAQKPINSDNSDSRVNLIDSFVAAISDTMHGVVVVFNGRVILGTRAKKTKSKSFSAFSSINYPEIAAIRDQHLFQYIEPKPESPLRFYRRLDENVGLLKLVPGTSPDVLSWLLDYHDALIIESFGVGGIPSTCDNRFYALIESAISRGKTVVMTTQVENEGSDLAIYRVGHELKKRLAVLEAYDMTTEAVVTKLMWILGVTNDPDGIRNLFYQPICQDILATDYLIH